MDTIEIAFQWHVNALTYTTPRCIVCGKRTMGADATWVEVVDGGDAVAATPGITDGNDPGYMGMWPLGRTCAAKVGVPASALTTIEKKRAI